MTPLIVPGGIVARSVKDATVAFGIVGVVDGPVGLIVSASNATM